MLDLEAVKDHLAVMNANERKKITPRDRQRAVADGKKLGRPLNDPEAR